MKITDVQTYETKVYTIKCSDGNGYYVTVSDSFEDSLFPQYHIIDFEHNEVEDEDAIEALIKVIEQSK